MTNDWLCETCGVWLRKCITCQKPFPARLTGRHKDQAYCSKSCARTGDWKNMTFSERRKFSISRAKRSPIGSRYKTWSSRRGKWYWVVKTEDGWEYEHRAIVAKRMGRPLTTDEHVHHRNEDGLNNSDDNLELLTAAEHTRLHHSKKGMSERTAESNPPI